ncbi:SRPBCC domain-containing protein [Chloroflexi bacterium TSY]|nr:SRPBCC domain-containing protein [Chloroflexi bacterium TSY]
MKVFTASANINAPAEAIWSILIDAPNYPEWDPSVIRIEGTIGLNNKITAYTKLSPDRAFPVTVTGFVPNQSMTWSGGMPLGLFKGVRTFTLNHVETSVVNFVVREEFSGLLLPIMGRSLPDLTQTFEDFVAGLKERAEGA